MIMSVSGSCMPCGALPYRVECETTISIKELTFHPNVFIFAYLPFIFFFPIFSVRFNQIAIVDLNEEIKGKCVKKAGEENEDKTNETHSFFLIVNLKILNTLLLCVYVS